jgi:hypothetical protein
MPLAVRWSRTGRAVDEGKRAGQDSPHGGFKRL